MSCGAMKVKGEWYGKGIGISLHDRYVYASLMGKFLKVGGSGVWYSGHDASKFPSIL